MTRRNMVEGVVLVALIALGVMLRVYFQEIPNFAPVAAMALFAGYYFRSWIVALCVPLGIMAISDMLIGSHQWQMMALVYGALAAPVALRGLLRRYFDVSRGGLGQAMSAAAGLVACGLGASLMFFLVTNFGSWLWFNMYEHSAAGLFHCYVQALPFLRYTLTGDLAFSVVLFGSFAIATQLGLASQPKKATV